MKPFDLKQLSAALDRVVRFDWQSHLRSRTESRGEVSIPEGLEAAGWESFFLGANVPAADLVRSLRDFEADLLVLSLGLALHVRTCAETLRQVRDELGEGAPRVLVGGPPFDLAPGLWRAVGADACAVDPSRALVEADRLVPPRRS